MGKTVYKVTGYHHKREYRKGDLEDDTVQCASEVFGTRKEVNEYLAKKAREAERNRYKTDLRVAYRGAKMPYLCVYTGDTWINENTGEEQEENYWYRVEKKTL